MKQGSSFFSCFYNLFLITSIYYFYDSLKLFIIFFPEICTDDVLCDRPDICSVSSLVGRSEKDHLPLNLSRCSTGLAGTPKMRFREDSSGHSGWLLLKKKSKTDGDARLSRRKSCYHWSQTIDGILFRTFTSHFPRFKGETLSEDHKESKLFTHILIKPDSTMVYTYFVKRCGHIIVYKQNVSEYHS